MKFSLKVKELKEALEKLGDGVDSYEVVFWDQGDDVKHCITRVKVHKRDEEVLLTNTNKHASWER